VKNLPYDITEDEVGDFFRSCGQINNVRFVYNQTKSHFKGYLYSSSIIYLKRFGYVEFKKPESAKNALGLNGKEIKGRRIYVVYS
jgi:RNA-binding proteins (RRM domain)